MLVQKCLGGAGDMINNDGTVSKGLAWCVGSKMAWSGGRGSHHLACWYKMDWRGRLGSIDRPCGPDGDREMQADTRLRAGGWNGSATIGS